MLYTHIYTYVKCTLGVLKVTMDCNLFEINISYSFRNIKAINLLCQQQHMKEIYYSEAKKLLFKNASTHSNQQLATPLEHSLRQISQRL